MNDTQRALVDTKYELLRLASFGFTPDRLVRISHEESQGWTSVLMGFAGKEHRSRRRHSKIVLIDFPKL